MQPVPRIFVSATSCDLKTARTLVSEGLRRMECLPIVQDDFPPDYKSVREMLVTKIKTCNAVVHLAGFYYGAEPQPVPPDPERRSFTQMEYEIAMELGLPCYVFLCGEKFPFDEHDPEPGDRRALQLAHRARLLSRDELFYEFDTREDLNSRTRELQLSVESLRDELAKERNRRRTTLVVSAVALLVAVFGGIFLLSQARTQEVAIKQTAAKLDEQNKIIEMLLEEQARLRGRDGGNTDLAAQAKKNVARVANLTTEQIRGSVESAIAAAEAAVAQSEGAAKADALKQLADARMAAGLETEAVESYRNRRELLDREKNPQQWVEAVANLADILFPRDYTSEEVPEMVQEALQWAISEKRLGADHPASLRIKESLRNIRFIKSDIAGAIELGREILKVRDRDLGKDAPESLDAATTLGRHYRSNGNYQDAEDLFHRVIESSKKLYGEDDVRTLNRRWDLARSYERQKRFSQAEEIYVDIIRRAKAALGEGTSDTLALGASLAFLKEAKGDDEGAMAIWLQLLEDAKQHNGADDALIQTYTHVVAVRMLETGNYAEAEKLYRQMYESKLRTVGRYQKDTIATMEGLKQVYSKKGDNGRYREILREIIDAKGKVLGRDSAQVATDQYVLGISLALDGHFEEGMKHVEDSLALRRRLFGSSDPITVATLAMVQTIANRMENWELAEKKGQETLAAFEAAQLNDGESYAMALYRLAVSKEKLGKNQAALGYVRRAAEIASEHVDKDHWLRSLPAEMVERLK